MTLCLGFFFLAGVFYTVSPGGVDILNKTVSLENFSNNFLRLGSKTVELSSDFNPPTEGKVIRADLEKMKLYLFADGLLQAEVDILSRGRKGTPWETPGGDYSVLFKEKNHFSSIGGVWMPYSLQFFGNFFIHGWPYYEDGTPVREGYSGGCIRLSTADAKVVFEFADKGTTVSVHATDEAWPDSFSKAESFYVLETAPLLEVSAQSFLVADLLTGEIILSKNETEVLPAGDLVYLPSTLVSLEVINQYRKISVSGSEAQMSTTGLVAGQEFVIGDLVYPLLFSLDPAPVEIFTRFYGKNLFLDRLTDKVQAIGLDDTVFVSPLVWPDNKTTSADVAKLARYIYDSKKFIWDTTALPSKNISGHSWVNDNKFVARKDFVGGIVGSENQAGVIIINHQTDVFGSRPIVVVVLGSTDPETDLENILKHIDEHITYGNESTLPSWAEILAWGGGLKNGFSKTKQVTINFVGDIMVDRGVRSRVENIFAGDYGQLFSQIPDLKTGDILFGNLEGPMSDRGENVGSIYSFRMNPQVLPTFVSAGFDVLSVANNHSGDWTVEAFADTVRRLRQVAIGAVGGGLNQAESKSPVIIEKNGLKVGFVGFTDVGPNWLTAGLENPGILIVDDNFSKIINEASRLVDVLVVSIHFGNEYEKTPSERQQTLARTAIDSGARVVAGHHPHVTQPVEEYRDGLIAYSLGNFIFDQNFSVETMSGMILDVIVRSGGIVSYDVRETRQDENFIPRILP